MNEKIKSFREILKRNVVLLTGGGGGIGLETAKILLYMGARVIIAENDKDRIKQAKELLKTENLLENVDFYKIDLTSRMQIEKMVKYIVKKYHFVDVLLNNATKVFLGEIENVGIKSWEMSYKINFKAPLLLTSKIIPLMKKENRGTVIFVSSSGAAPYMGAYEIFKTSQVELSNTLHAEIEKTNIAVYTISPGLVKTETATNAIKIISQKMGISTDEFYKMNETHILRKEEAGLGFALSILKSKEYSGQEISSIQVLNDFDLYDIVDENIEIDSRILDTIKKVIQKFNEQYNGWMQMNIFEKQWVLRDFKKTVGMSANECYEKLDFMIKEIMNSYFMKVNHMDLIKKLKNYFERQYKLLQGYEKNPTKLKIHSDYLLELIHNIETVIKI